MIQVIMKYDNICKYFYYIGDIAFILGTDNKNILNYMNFLKYWIEEKYIVNNKILNGFVEYSNLILKEKILTSNDYYIGPAFEVVNKSDVLVFEFPKEMKEEAFYFKMKYC